MARIGSGGMEGIALMFMDRDREGWKVDLRELVTGNSWTPEDPAAFQYALEAWEQVILEPLEELADHRESGMSMTDMIGMSMGDGEKNDDIDPMKMMKDMMGRQQKRTELIDAANEITDDAASSLSLLLPLDESDAFDLFYGLASVPSIGRDPDLLDPAFEKALTLDSLRMEQREALAGLAADYRASLREVNQQMLGMHRRMPNIDMGSMFGAMMPFGDKGEEGDGKRMQEQFELQQNLQKQIDRLRAERKDLHQKTREQLKASGPRPNHPGWSAVARTTTASARNPANAWGRHDDGRARLLNRLPPDQMLFRHPSAELCTTRWMNFTPAARLPLRGRRTSRVVLTSTDSLDHAAIHVGKASMGPGVARGN